MLEDEQENALRVTLESLLSDLDHGQLSILFQCCSRRRAQLEASTGGAGIWQKMVKQGDVIAAVKYIRATQRVGLFDAVNLARSYQYRLSTAGTDT